MARFKTKCIDSGITTDQGSNEGHYVFMSINEENTGMFGSKIQKVQFEKIESALRKRYFRLPFGIRVLI